MTRLIAALALAAAVLPTAALAGPECTKEPQAKWMTEDAMKAEVAKLGYQKIRTFKVTGSCYEIYGFNSKGQKAEVYFNPVTGAIVKAEEG